MYDQWCIIELNMVYYMINGVLFQLVIIIIMYDHYNYDQ